MTFSQLLRAASILTLAAGLTAFAAQARDVSIPPGAGTIEVPGAAPDGTPVTVWTYRPAGLEPGDRIVFVMHGVKRNADVYRDNWVEHAKKHRFLLAVPEMSRRQFPKSRGYNLGNMFAKGAIPKPPGQSSWATIDKVFEAVRTRSGSTRTTFSIFGHSAGGQFVHRLILFAANPRVDVAIAANPGWYTMPDSTIRFPYGLEGSPMTPARLKAAFAMPLEIHLGDEDTNPNHRYLRRSAKADRQGTNRFERGQTFFAQARAEARRLGAAFNWRLQVVSGVAHDNAGMSEAAVRAIFPQK